MNIYAEDLIRNVNADPYWIEKHATQENPVEVVGYCDLSMTGILKLSPFITFCGNPPRREKSPTDGMSVSFKNCPWLTRAEGTFNGHVDFTGCKSLKEIDPALTVFPDEQGNAAAFNECDQLKKAAGTFHGAVRFCESGIKEIDTKNFKVTRCNDRGTAASFSGCKDLEAATGTYPGWVNFTRSGIRSIKDLTITKSNQHGTAATFQQCGNLRNGGGSFNGNVCFEASGIVAIHNLKLDDPNTQFINLAHCPTLRDCQSDVLNHPNTKFESDQKRHSIQERKRVREKMKAVSIEI